MHSRFFKIWSFSALQYLTLLSKKVFFGKQLFSQTTLKQEMLLKEVHSESAISFFCTLHFHKISIIHNRLVWKFMKIHEVNMSLVRSCIKIRMLLEKVFHPILKPIRGGGRSENLVGKAIIHWVYLDVT